MFFFFFFFFFFLYFLVENMVWLCITFDNINLIKLKAYIHNLKRKTVPREMFRMHLQGSYIVFRGHISHNSLACVCVLGGRLWVEIFPLSCWLSPSALVTVTFLLLNTTCPVLAISINPNLLASEDANCYGSAQFVINYVNFYQELVSSNLI